MPEIIGDWNLEAGSSQEQFRGNQILEKINRGGNQNFQISVTPGIENNRRAKNQKELS